jgi:hypothetical protein
MPTRWMNQGAIEAISIAVPIDILPDLEVALKNYANSGSIGKKMLKKRIRTLI